MVSTTVLNDMILLTPEQLGEFMHLSKNSAYKLMKEKGFPSFRVGKKWYVKDTDLLRWINNQTKHKRK